MSRGPDIGTRLARALEASGPGVAVTGRSVTRWASVTFTGARHEIDCTAPASPALEQWFADLPEKEFAFPGHLVADLTIAGMTATPERIDFRIEALTVET